MKSPTLPPVEIPEKLSEPSDDLTNYSALIYGESGIGKTTLASRAEGALFLATEPGLDGIPHRAIQCPTWEHLLAAHQKVLTSPGKCKVVVLDTLAGAYSLCERYILQEYRADHLNAGALGYGAGRRVVSNHFFALIQDLCRVPNVGFWCITHDKIVTVPDPDGDYQRHEPNLPDDNLSAMVQGYVSLILFCRYENVLGTDAQGNQVQKRTRVMFTGGDRTILAKDRSGRLPQKLPLSYFELEKAWKAAKKPAKNGQKGV